MKKILIFLIGLLGVVTMTALAQIPNPGFEFWTSGNPDGWATTNAFPSLVNVTQSTDCHSWLYAVRGDVIDYFFTLVSPIIQTGPQGTGFAISEQYRSLELYYRFLPNGGDRFSVNVALFKGGDPIAQGAVALPAVADDYTHLTVSLSYTVNEVPDWAIIEITIIGPVTGSDYHLGSVMYADDLSFSFSTGDEDVPAALPAGSCYPVPAADEITIRLPVGGAGEVAVTVYDAFGREVKKAALLPQPDGSGACRISVRDLPPGVYLFSVTGTNSRNAGRFIVRN